MELAEMTPDDYAIHLQTHGGQSLARYIKSEDRTNLNPDARKKGLERNLKGLENLADDKSGNAKVLFQVLRTLIRTKNVGALDLEEEADAVQRLQSAMTKIIKTPGPGSDLEESSKQWWLNWTLVSALIYETDKALSRVI